MNDTKILLGAVRAAQQILAKQLEPGGLSDHQALNELHGALDNPIVIEAQKRLGDDPTKPHFPTKA